MEIWSQVYLRHCLSVLPKILEVKWEVTEAWWSKKDSIMKINSAFK